MNRAKRFCSGDPHCTTLTDGGPCPAHSLQREQRRGSSNDRGYTYRWYLRAQRFRRHYPFCGMRPGDQPPVMSTCHDTGILTPAFQVDHVIPHRGNQTLFWDETHNWQSLCRECGAKKSAAGM